jgi:putative oxidoreductase
MSIFEASRTMWTSRMLSVFRMVAGLIFISYGSMKVFGYPASPTPMPPFNPASLLGVAGMLELIGGTAILLGLLARPVAFVLAGEMAVAYFRVHFPQSVFPVLNNGVPPVLFCFLFLYMTFAGAGAWSLDALLSRKKWLEMERPDWGRPEPELELVPPPMQPRQPRQPLQPRPPLQPSQPNMGHGRPVLHRG